MNRPKLWTRDFVYITATQFLFSLNFYLLMVIIAGYAMDTFNSSPSIAGLAASIFLIGAFITRPLSGRWIERAGRKKTLYSGLILGLTMSLLYLVGNSIIALLVIRFLHGVAFGLFSTAAGTIIADIVPGERRGEGLGYFALSLTLAMAIGPFVSIFISQHSGYEMVFITAGGVALLSLLSAFFVSVREISLTEKQLAEMKGFRFSNFFEPGVIPISLVCMVFFFCYSSILSFFAVYAKEIHLEEAARYFFIILAVVIFTSRPFVGRLFDSKGENVIMYSAFSLFIVGMSILSQAYQGYVLLLSGIIIGLGYGAIQSTSVAIYVKITEPHRMGLATSTFCMFLDAGVGIGPFILGLFIPLTGYRGMYLWVVIIAAGCMLLYYLLHGRRYRHSRLETNSMV